MAEWHKKFGLNPKLERKIKKDAVFWLKDTGFDPWFEILEEKLDYPDSELYGKSKQKIQIKGHLEKRGFERKPAFIVDEVIEDAERVKA